MSYRKNFEKVYQRVDTIAKQGKLSIYDYFELVDQLTAEGLFMVFSDVMFQKYGLSLERYADLNDFVKNSFRIIRQRTNFNISLDYEDYFNYRNVYAIGNRYYDKTNDLFLGEIIETRGPLSFPWYLSSTMESENITDVQFTYGLTTQQIGSISTFLDDSVTKGYKISDIYEYQDSYWNCYKGYTYSSTNRITPTFSSNWVSINHITYSYNVSTGDSRLEKWTEAVDGLKSFLYSDPNSTNVGAFSLTAI